jgi:hypothetical protein
LQPIAGHNAVLDERLEERIDSQWQEGSVANESSLALLEVNQGKKPRLTAGLHGTRFKHILEFSLSLHFRHQLFLALRKLLAERLEIHFGGFEFRE